MIKIARIVAVAISILMLLTLMGVVVSAEAQGTPDDLASFSCGTGSDLFDPPSNTKIPLIIGGAGLIYVGGTGFWLRAVRGRRKDT